MAEKKKYNSILISGRKDQTLTYSKYVKDEESGESVKESLDKKVNVTDELTTQQIKDGAITNEKMAADSVGNSNLQDGSVSNEKLEDGSITNEKLAKNSITKDKLKDNTIGVEKLDPELRQTINAATGLPENLVETIQNVDDTLKDHQCQLDDKQSQIDDKQQQITANDEDISLLQTRSTQMEETIKSIAATGGASQATAVTYDNEKSGLTATNAQAAIDETNTKLSDLGYVTEDFYQLIVKGYWNINGENKVELESYEDMRTHQNPIDLDKTEVKLIASSDGSFGALNDNIKKIIVTDSKLNVLWSSLNGISPITLSKDVLPPSAKYAFFNAFNDTTSIKISYFKKGASYNNDRCKELSQVYEDLASNTFDYYTENRMGIAFSSRINAEILPSSNNVVKLTSPLCTDKNYYVKVSTDVELKRLVIINPTNNKYLLDIKDVDSIKDYVFFYSGARETEQFHVYQENNKGVICHITISVGEIKKCSIEGNKQRIETFCRDLDIDRLSMENAHVSVLDTESFMLAAGDQELASFPFKAGKSYRIQFFADSNLSVDDMVVYGDIVDRYNYHGLVNQMDIIVTPLFDTDSLRYSFHKASFTRSYVKLKITQLDNYVGEKWSLIRRNTFKSSSTSLLQDIYLLYPTPFLVKGLTYKVILYFATPVSFLGGFLNLSTIPYAGEEKTTQISIEGKDNTQYLEITFVAPHDIYRVWSTFSFKEIPNLLGGDAYLLKIGTTAFSIEEKHSLELSSNSVGILFSYNSFVGDEASRQMSLAFSSDGMHFRKLVSPFSYEGEFGNSLTNDFCIFKKGNSFYLTASSLMIEDGKVVTRILKSNDLNKWTLHQTLYFPTSLFPVEEGNKVLAIWAPEILYLNGKYYYSFAVGEAENPYVEKGYIAELNEELNAYTKVRSMTINANYSKYTFDNTFLWDEERNRYLGYFLDGSIYESTSIDGEWKAIGSLPLQEYGFSYMEGGTILKYKGWYYIYGDATIAVSGKINNLLVFKTRDFKKYIMVNEQFDNNIRHGKAILVDALDCAVINQYYIDRTLSR
mgnify:CR=1 FL=1|nr:MAG TPA: glycoside hydrolase family protein [Caudoviricetes sp.]